MSSPDLTVTDEERRAGRLEPARFAEAALRLRARGYVVLREAVSPALIEAARDAFARIFRDCVESRDGDGWYQVSRREQAVFWERGGRWRIFPKLRPPLADPDLLANPLVLGLLDALLGDFFCKFVASDTCVRGCALQAPHRELGAGGAPAPRAYVLNVPLTPCRGDNGPLEVWPVGSHLWPAEVLARYGLSDDVQDGPNEAMEAFAALLPSRRLTLEPGSLLVRDPGMLHRGTPSTAAEPRTMLTVCYFQRGHVHDYGEARFNLDGELPGLLAPAVRRLFAGALDGQPAPAVRAGPAAGAPRRRRPGWWRWPRRPP